MTNNFEQNLAVTMEQVKNLDKKVDTGFSRVGNSFDKVDKHIDEIKSMIKEQDEKFAGKWVEKVAIGVLISLIAGVLAIVITLQ
jgi:hypothetical protein